ncbi:hypothetical protein Tco_0728995 [Tanacetum coccineum]|uniref:Uncharacterized protein n=1 Tax=Tanacetum coccineum TaxID=301880 RepID=A0ABQ4YMN2_9ASTR
MSSDSAIPILLFTSEADQWSIPTEEPYEVGRPRQLHGAGTTFSRIMRTQALEAGARVDTLEDTGSSS